MLWSKKLKKFKGGVTRLQIIYWENIVYGPICFPLLDSLLFFSWLQNNQGVTPNVDLSSVVVNSIIEGGVNVGKESVVSHCHLQVHACL